MVWYKQWGDAIAWANSAANVRYRVHAWHISSTGLAIYLVPSLLMMVRVMMMVLALLQCRVLHNSSGVVVPDCHSCKYFHVGMACFVYHQCWNYCSPSCNFRQFSFNTEHGTVSLWQLSFLLSLQDCIINCVTGNVVYTNCWWHWLPITSSSLNQGNTLPAIYNISGHGISRLVTQFTAFWEPSSTCPESNFVVGRSNDQCWPHQTSWWTSNIHRPSPTAWCTDCWCHWCTKLDWKCSTATKCQQLSDAGLVASQWERRACGGYETVGNHTIDN